MNLRFAQFICLLVSATNTWITPIQKNFLITQGALVSKHSPHAQAWFEQVAEKYPQAKLHNVPFKIYIRDNGQFSPLSYSLFTSIYFSDYLLNEIENALDLLNKPGFLDPENPQDYSDCKPTCDQALHTLKVCEFLLLREAAHIFNKDFYVRASISTLQWGIFGCLIGHATTAPQHASKTFWQKTKWVLIRDMIQEATLSTINYVYARRSEILADEFAFKTCDQETFNAAINWLIFVESTEQQLLEEYRNNPWLYKALSFLINNVQVTPQSRLQVAEKIYNQRFSHT